MLGAVDFRTWLGKEIIWGESLKISYEEVRLRDCTFPENAQFYLFTEINEVNVKLNINPDDSSGI